MFSSVAEVMGHPAYEAFKAHHDGCEQCQTALTLPTIDPETNEVRMLNPRRPDQPYLGVFEGFLSRDMCD